jgi:hypothetical protein
MHYTRWVGGESQLSGAHKNSALVFKFPRQISPANPPRAFSLLWLYYAGMRTFIETIQTQKRPSDEKKHTRARRT